VITVLVSLGGGGRIIVVDLFGPLGVGLEEVLVVAEGFLVLFEGPLRDSVKTGSSIINEGRGQVLTCENDDVRVEIDLILLILNLEQAYVRPTLTLRKRHQEVSRLE
jgi:hypothetical protein